jgi:hypothetical protein
VYLGSCSGVKQVVSQNGVETQIGLHKKLFFSLKLLFNQFLLKIYAVGIT